MSNASDDLAEAALALTEAMRATCSDPLDAIRILTAFIGATLAQPMQSSAQAATAAVFRRSAMGSLALACADYQPSSSNDSSAMINSVAGLIDTEVVAAADGGDLLSYASLRNLRYAIVADLTARSAGLPDLVTIALPGPLPSLAMAYRLYADTTREPDMVSRAAVIHPGFLPPSFEALSQ